MPLNDIFSIFQKKKSNTVRKTKQDTEVINIEFDASKARSLYRNIDKNNYLGAQLVRPIINNKAGFAGLPKVSKKDGTETDAMKAFNERKGDHRSILVDTMIESMIYSRVDWRDGGMYSDLPEIFIELLPDKRVEPIRDPLLGFRVVGYEVYTTVGSDPNDASKTYKQVERITKQFIEITRSDGELPTGLKPYEKIPNRYGIINIVPIKNAKDKFDTGTSEIEAIIPLINQYHKVMTQAAMYSSMYTKAPVKFKIDNWDNFRKMNPDLVDGDGAINIGDGAIYAVARGDDVEYITFNSKMSDFTTLLEYLYINIIEAAEVPEFAMGGAISSSKASAEEQQIIIKRLANDIRISFHDQFKQLYQVFQTVYNKGNNLQPEDITDVLLDWYGVQDIVLTANNSQLPVTTVPTPAPTPTPVPPTTN